MHDAPTVTEVGSAAPAAWLTTVRVLMAEYAALPHTAGRWPTVRADLAALPQPFVEPVGVLLVAHAGDEPLGCGALAPLTDGSAEIKRVYVRTTARGRGVGEMLTRALMTHAVRLGYHTVRLDTAPELLAAQALYRRLGFVSIPHYRDGLLPDALCFERTLTAVDGRADR